MTIYDFDDYRTYIKDVHAASSENRGLRNRLAVFLGCQPAFISQVLSLKMHFSQEMLFRAGEFLKLSSGEIDFLFALYHNSRAGSRELKNYYESELSKMREARDLVKEQLKINRKLDSDAEIKFYSNSLYIKIALYSSLSTPQTQTQLAQTLQAEPEEFREALEFLAAHNLIRIEKSLIKAGSTMLHLDRNSPLYLAYQAQWRAAATQSIFRKREDDLHYNSQFACSEKDFEKIKKTILSCLSQVDKVIDKSEQLDDVFVWTLDLFRMK